MDETNLESISNFQVLIFIFLLIAVILCLRLRPRKKETINTAEVEWKIEVLPKDGNKTETKIGTGLNDLYEQQMESISFLQIKQSHLNIMQVFVNWNLINLTALYLNSNKIQSIERLGWATFPNLQALDLSNNLILQLSPLRKLNVSNLILLSLNNNPISNRLDLSYFNLTNLQYLWLEFFESERHFHDDIRTFAKAQCNHLLKFHIKSAERISNKSFIQVLERKYANIDIRKKNP